MDHPYHARDQGQGAGGLSLRRGAATFGQVPADGDIGCLSRGDGEVSATFSVHGGLGGTKCMDCCENMKDR